ncbi:MAG: hypothetical protein DLM50_05935 [Candidatus Meridianibacter frigidus]|nr:MAG: hypothetical protein DLM50_05935 [Candidatus Eremiobacteraeota bacterium]
MYPVLKAFHILAVVVFLGTILLGIFWKRIADRTASARIIAHTIGGIIQADRIFTMPSIVIIVAAGVGMGFISGVPFLGTGWLLWGIVLFIIAGLAFIPLARVQLQLHEIALGGLSSQAEREQYQALSHRWNLWGSIALITPLFAFFLMVVKPALPVLHH